MEPLWADRIEKSFPSFGHMQACASVCGLAREVPCWILILNQPHLHIPPPPDALVLAIAIQGDLQGALPPKLFCCQCANSSSSRSKTPLQSGLSLSTHMRESSEISLKKINQNHHQGRPLDEAKKKKKGIFQPEKQRTWE